MLSDKLFRKDKKGQFRSINTVRAAKEAGIEDIGEFFMDEYLNGMDDLTRNHEDRLKDAATDEQNELFPPGFIPYNDVWRYEPVDSNYFCRKFVGFDPTPLQQEALNVVCGEDPFKFTNSDYEEIDLMWGKRSGKDSIIALGIDYQSYKMSCMVDPQSFLGFGPGSSIDIVNVASNADQAKKVFFSYIVTYLKMCKDPETKRNWFATRNFWWDVGKNDFVYMDLREKDGHIQKGQVDFGRGIKCHSLTSERFTAEGLNLILAIMDEFGSMRPEKVFGDTERLIGQYDSLSATVRATSTKRFGKLLVMSYKYGKNCPMSMLIKRNKKDPKKFVKVYSVYDVRKDVEESKLKEMFASEYLKDPEKAAMMYECKEPQTDVEALYSNIFILKRAFDTAGKYTVNPIRNKLVTIDNISVGADKLLESWFVGDPNKYYTIHFDLAKGRVYKKQDAAALAMGHIEEMKLSFDKYWVEFYKKFYGVDLTELEGQIRYGVVIDLAIQIVCTPDDQEVRLSEVRQFGIDLSRKRGFNIFKATIDGWQSVETVQELNRNGLETELLSVDKTPVAHHTMKDFVQLGLFKIYEHPIWERETSELEDLGNKVDHPELSTKRFELEGYEHGSKDVADCTAGVCYTLSSEMSEGGDILLQ